MLRDVDEAQSYVTTLTTQLNEHIQLAAEEKRECECKVRAEYNRVYRTATENEGEDARAYAKCKHMNCFLENKRNSANCLQLEYQVPTVKQRNDFAEGVPAQECEDGSGSGFDEPDSRRIARSASRRVARVARSASRRGPLGQ